MLRGQGGLTGRDRYKGLKGSTMSAPALSETHAAYDAAYFQAYAHVAVHEEMIKDRVRTETYMAAIQQHQDLIQDKVYAVDASEITVQAREIVKANNLSDKITVIIGKVEAREIVKANNLSDKITVIIGKVEEVDIDEKVDVIVSEWMGYMLLYELYLAPITHPERYSDSIDFLKSVYGIDMSPMLPLAKQCAFEEPLVEVITGENVLTWPTVVKDINCNTITVQELELVTAEFIVTSMMNGDG